MNVNCTVSVLDSCFNTDLFSVVLQYCNGGDLAEYLHGEFPAFNPRVSSFLDSCTPTVAMCVCGEGGGYTPSPSPDRRSS